MTKKLLTVEEERLDKFVEALQKIEYARLKARKELDEELLAIHERQFGIKLNVTVKYKGKKYIVVGVSPSEYHTRHGSKPWVSGKLIKKDGSISERSNNLYTNWEIVP